MTVQSRIEVTIKVNQIPTTELTENNWHQFMIDCDGKEVSGTVKPKIWNKFKSQAEQYSESIAAIQDGIGEISSNAFVLE